MANNQIDDNTKYTTSNAGHFNHLVDTAVCPMERILWLHAKPLQDFPTQSPAAMDHGLWLHAVISTFATILSTRVTQGIALGVTNEGSGSKL